MLSESRFGLTSFNFPPMDVLQHTRPLLKFPAEDLAFGFWLYPRSVAADNNADYTALIEANNSLMERMRSVGGKGYPPFAPHSTVAQWKEHYGSATWRRLLDAKTKYDPNNVLTPGPGIFSDFRTD